MDRLGGSRPLRRHARQKTCLNFGRYDRRGIIDDELASCIGRIESIEPGHSRPFIRREGIHSAAEPHEESNAVVEYATLTGRLRPNAAKRKQLY